MTFGRQRKGKKIYINEKIDEANQEQLQHPEKKRRVRVAQKLFIFNDTPTNRMASLPLTTTST